MKQKLDEESRAEGANHKIYTQKKKYGWKSIILYLLYKDVRDIELFVWNISVRFLVPQTCAWNSYERSYTVCLSVICCCFLILDIGSKIVQCLRATGII